uniref:(northern house mosquito) hypothetical protein n=1 Tax=Culex pipiens TaxID=7175 RepID=A0A8D8ADT4_CULPI
MQTHCPAACCIPCRPAKETRFRLDRFYILTQAEYRESTGETEGAGSARTLPGFGGSTSCKKQSLNVERLDELGLTSTSLEIRTHRSPICLVSRHENPTGESSGND